MEASQSQTLDTKDSSTWRWAASVWNAQHNENQQISHWLWSHLSVSQPPALSAIYCLYSLGCLATLKARLWFSSFNIFFYLVMWNIERQTHRHLPSSGSLPNCPPQTELGTPSGSLCGVARSQVLEPPKMHVSFKLASGAGPEPQRSHSDGIQAIQAAPLEQCQSPASSSWLYN